MPLKTQPKQIARIETQAQFSLQNLQPINYLKTFNKMLEYMNKTPNPTSLPPPQKQLKTVRLSKFPLHEYYYQMEGIFQSSHKKNQDDEKNHREQAKFELYEEKFLDKHYKFVKDALRKIIGDNQSQQQKLQKQKHFLAKKGSQIVGKYIVNQQQALKMVKMRSQPKIRSGRLMSINLDSARKASNDNSLNNLLLKRTGVRDQQTTNTQYSLTSKPQTKLSTRRQNEEQHNPIFKKLLPPRKQEKFRKRKADQIDEILSARKTFQQSLKKNSQKQKLPNYPLTQRKHKAESILKNGTIHDHNYNKEAQKYQNQKTNNYKSVKLHSNYIEQNQEQEEKGKFHMFNKQEFCEFQKQISILPKSQLKSSSNLADSVQTIDERQDEDVKFFKQIEGLQNQQMTIQRQYASRIDEKIKKIKLKMNQKIHQVIKFDFSQRKTPSSKPSASNKPLSSKKPLSSNKTQQSKPNQIAQAESSSNFLMFS